MVQLVVQAQTEQRRQCTSQFSTQFLQPYAEFHSQSPKGMQIRIIAGAKQLTIPTDSELVYKIACGYVRYMDPTALPHRFYCGHPQIPDAAAVGHLQ